MGQDLTQPTNTILAGGEPVIEEFEVGANATAAKMLPGRFVIYDTNAGDIKESGAKAHGVKGVLMEKPNGSLTTAYAVGDIARVITGGKGVKVMVTFASGGAATTSDVAVVTAADGKAAILAVGALGTQGDICGKAEEVVDPAAADKKCVISLNIIPEADTAA